MRKAAYIFIPIFSLSVSFQNIETKKDVLSQVVAKYLPENLEIIHQYPPSTIDFLAKGDSISEYIFSLPLVIHEAYHSFGHVKQTSDLNKRDYRINDTLTISITAINSFPSIELNEIVSVNERESIFRYSTYINTKDTNHDTQKNGFLGLLEEFNAYYQEFKTYIALNGFIKDKYGYSDPSLWQNYLCDLGSVRYSLDEFQIFISYYIQFAQLEYPSIYDEILSDSNIKTLFTFISDENVRLKNEYQIIREETLKKLSNELVIDGEWLRYDGVGKGTHDAQAATTQKILNTEKKEILNAIKTTFNKK